MLLLLLHCAVKVFWHPHRGTVLGVAFPRVLGQGKRPLLLT
jgi:hypothetical protein